MSEPPTESLFVVPESYVDRLRFDTVFPLSQPVEVEIGAGDGSFLLQYADRHPGRNLLGVERLLGRIRKIDRRGRREGLKNLRVMRIEAQYFVEYLLPMESVDAFHIYFPDPWPKVRHEKNRLLQPEFVGQLAAALRPDGSVYLRTDNEPYFEQMQAVFNAAVMFEPTDTPDSLKSIVTDFEADFVRRGIRTRYAAYRKRTSPRMTAGMAAP